MVKMLNPVRVGYKNVSNFGKIIVALCIISYIIFIWTVQMINLTTAVMAIM